MKELNIKKKCSDCAKSNSILSLQAQKDLGLHCVYQSTPASLHQRKYKMWKKKKMCKTIIFSIQNYREYSTHCCFRNVPSGRRRGFMGHLTKMANSVSALVEKNDSPSLVKDHFNGKKQKNMLSNKLF